MNESEYSNEQFDSPIDPHLEDYLEQAKQELLLGKRDLAEKRIAYVVGTAFGDSCISNKVIFVESELIKMYEQAGLNDPTIEFPGLKYFMELYEKTCDEEERKLELEEQSAHLPFDLVLAPAGEALFVAKGVLTDGDIDLLLYGRCVSSIAERVQ